MAKQLVGADVIVPIERIQRCIFLLRGEKVMLDRDLAQLYGVATKVLNQAVKRNIRRFPDDFMFKLDKAESERLVTNCDRFRSLKYAGTTPYAFTEQGIAMLSSVLGSSQAVEVNIAIMRTFVHLRRIMVDNSLLRARIESLEKKYDQHDEQIQQVFGVLKAMLTEETKPQKQIGYHAEAEGTRREKIKAKKLH